MLPSDSDILAIAQSVLEQMANIGVVEACAPGELTGERITGCIDIDGEWNGAVLLRATPGLVRNAASHIFDRPVDEVIESEMQDSLAELTNMIGGNIKSQVPGPSSLSIPRVVDELESIDQFRDAKVVAQVPLACGDQQLDIVMYER